MSLSVVLFLLCLTALILVIVDMVAQRCCSLIHASVFLMALALTVATARGLSLL